MNSHQFQKNLNLAQQKQCFTTLKKNTTELKKNTTETFSIFRLKWYGSTKKIEDQ